MGDDLARGITEDALQRLFALGLELQHLGRTMGDASMRDAVDELVDQLDETTRRLRVLLREYSA